jgi:erythromycin esterase-like protein
MIVDSLKLLRLSFVAIALWTNGVSLAAPPALTKSERKLVKLACQHSLVLVGENSHGDGGTISIKGKIIPELVRKCDFSLLVFESSFYDFAELTRIASPIQTYDREKFISSVGMIWSQTVEFRPFADWIARQSPRKIFLGGIDDQVGSRGAFYSITKMPRQLADYSPAEDRVKCANLLSFKGWPGLNADLQRTATDQCLSEISAALALEDNDHARHLSAMAIAYRRSIARSGLPAADYNAARDRAMADNLDVFRMRSPQGTKIIVWVANAHAATGGFEIGSTLGQIVHERYGNEAFSIGFSAAGGQFRWSQADVRDVPVAHDISLEARILRGRESAVATRKELAAMGRISGSALSWHQVMTADWSKLFDAIFVLRSERPTSPEPDATPP